MSERPRHRVEVPGIDPPPSVNPALARRRRSRWELETAWESLVSGDVAALSQAITLVESSRPEDQELAVALVDRAVELDRPSQRIGLTGMPGVGKSSLIEKLGLRWLLDESIRLAVLAIDPSSTVTSGSVLGDKSRMPGLSRHPRAFIRPSPTRGTLGGVALATREAVLLCEAAGFNRVVVETVGVGQSETDVSQMVDFFVLLTLAGAGDELQGIKRGILELADLVVVTKADGANIPGASLAASQLVTALRLSGSSKAHVTTVSTLDDSSVLDLFNHLVESLARVDKETLRSRQSREWAYQAIQGLIKSHYPHDERMRRALDRCEYGQVSPRRAAMDWWKEVNAP